jgi:hypothetical protein
MVGGRDIEVVNVVGRSLRRVVAGIRGQCCGTVWALSASPVPPSDGGPRPGDGRDGRHAADYYAYEFAGTEAIL